MLFRLIVAASISFLITVLGHYYLYLRLVEPLALQSDGLWKLIFFILWLMTFFGFPLARMVPILVRRGIEFFMFTWVGTAYHFLILCILTSPISLLLHFSGASEKYLSISLICLGSVGVLYSLFTAMSGETVVRKAIPIRNELPDSLQDLKVVVLSDIHVAGLIGRKRMRRLKDKVNALQPDLVFVTGDLVDGTVRQLKNDVLPLKEISAPLGVFYVTGNHEYYCNAPKWREYCEKELGWNVLSNRTVSVAHKGSRLNIIGIEDRSSLHLKGGKRLSDHRIESAVQEISLVERQQGLNILLAHQPKDTHQTKLFPWIDIQISGHTHGGQLWPLQVFVYSDQKYNVGLYKLETGTQLYVTEGTGFWGPPMRLGTKCEISLLTFEKSKVV